jgi:hypothetical protein
MVQMFLLLCKPELEIFFFGLVFAVNIMDVGCLQTFIDGLQGEQAHGSPNSSNASSFHVQTTHLLGRSRPRTKHDNTSRKNKKKPKSQMKE